MIIKNKSSTVFNSGCAEVKYEAGVRVKVRARARVTARARDRIVAGAEPGPSHIPGSRHGSRPGNGQSSWKFVAVSRAKDCARARHSNGMRTNNY